MATNMLCVDDALDNWGAQRVLHDVAVRVARRGLRLTLAAPRRSAQLARWTESGLPNIALDLAEPGPPRNDAGRIRLRPLTHMVLSSPQAVTQIRRAARLTGADALLANSHPTQFDTVLAGRLCGVPTTLLLHEQLPFRLGRILRRAAVQLAAQTIAVSPDVLAELSRGPRSDQFVVMNGVDVRRFHPGEADSRVRGELGAAAGEVLFVAVTRLDPVKRVEDLLHAATSLPEGLAWHLAIVGDTTSSVRYAAGVKALAEDVLPGKVTFTGIRADMPDVMRAADVVVHAGSVEGLPLGLLEAQACGTPVVAYRAGGVTDLVQDGRTGTVVDVGDRDGLTSGMLRLAQDEDLRTRQGQAAAARIRDRFDQQIQADTLATLWEKL